MRCLPSVLMGFYLAVIAVELVRFLLQSDDIWMLAKIRVQKLLDLKSIEATSATLLDHANRQLLRGTQSLNTTKSACSVLVQQLATMCFVDWVRPRFSKAAVGISGSYHRCREEEGVAAGLLSTVGRIYQVVADIGCAVSGAKMSAVARALLLCYTYRGYHGHAISAASRMPFPKRSQ